MNRYEFIKTCVEGGYCPAKTAREYRADKVEFDINDIQDVYRINQRRLDAINRAGDERFQYVGESKTTKRYLLPSEEWDNR